MCFGLNWSGSPYPQREFMKPSNDAGLTSMEQNSEPFHHGRHGSSKLRCNGWDCGCQRNFENQGRPGHKFHRGLRIFSIDVDGFVVDMGL